MRYMRQSANLQWAACVCLLYLTAPPLSAAQHLSQNTGHAGGTPYTAGNSISPRLFSKRFLVENSTSSTVITSAPGSAAAPPASKPTLLQAADVTFRLLGSDALPFSNATATAFQRALHGVFSNFSSAAFWFHSATVMTLALHCTQSLLRYDVASNAYAKAEAQHRQRNICLFVALQCDSGH